MPFLFSHAYPLRAGGGAAPGSSPGSSPSSPTEPEGTVFLVTVSSGTVGSDLTAFPLCVDLADMPAAFWSAVNADGSNVRVRNNADASIPFDLAIFEHNKQRGSLFIRTDLASASDTIVKVVLTSDTVRLVPTDTNGRNAVWADFAAVTLLGFDPVDRTGNSELRSTGDAQFAEGTVVHTFTQDPHQGGTFDGTHHYIVDTNAIYKFDASWTLVATNADPIGDTALPTVNHLGDPTVKDGVLYIPLEFYDGTSSNEHIVEFDPSDLSFIQAHDISSVGAEVSSICFCPRDGLFYVTDYIGDTIQKYNTSFVHQGAATMSRTIEEMQGIEWFAEGFFIVSDQLDEVMRMEFDGTIIRNTTTNTAQGLFGTTVSGNLEGIWKVGDTLHVLSDPSAANSFATSYENFGQTLFAAGGYSCDNQEIDIQPVASGTTWTLGVSGLVTNKSANGALVSYRDLSAGATNDRATLAYRTATSSIDLWDDANSWVAGATYDPATNEYFRAHAVYEGTTARRLYTNGTELSSDLTITAQDVDFDCLSIGYEDGSSNENWVGEIGYAYLRMEAMSPDWIAAEYLNLNDPASFYAVSSA